MGGVEVVVLEDLEKMRCSAEGRVATTMTSGARDDEPMCC